MRKRWVAEAAAQRERRRERRSVKESERARERSVRRKEQVREKKTPSSSSDHLGRRTSLWTAEPVAFRSRIRHHAEPEDNLEEWSLVEETSNRMVHRLAAERRLLSHEDQRARRVVHQNAGTSPARQSRRCWNVVALGSAASFVFDLDQPRLRNLSQSSSQPKQE